MEDIHTENQYTNCYIAFLDLLGFKKRIKESSCEDILRIFSEMKNPLKKIYIGKENKAHLLPGPESINTKVMSDSICFWINATAPNALYSLLSCCAIFQAKLDRLLLFQKFSAAPGGLYAVFQRNAAIDQHMLHALCQRN